MSVEKYIILSNKDGVRLDKKYKRAHKISLKYVKNQEEKKRHKILTDTTYEPKDKDKFINNIELWRILCYNTSGVI